MQHIWQLAVREIKERKLLFVVALALGLVAPVLSLLREMDVLIVALVLAVGLGHGVALLVGATTVNRPLREGRLGFFFNRPVGEGSLWWGKLLGTFLLSAIAQVLAFLPALLWSLVRGIELSDSLAILGASVAGLLGSVLVGHVFGTMIGSRSKASLADLAALVVSASLLWFAWSRLSELFAVTAQVALLSLVGVAGLAGALVGGWRQVKLGRVDGGRSHRALSLSVWTATLTAALLGFGFSSWVRDVDPADMAVLAVSSGSETPWLVTQQTYPDEDLRTGVATQFLVNAETGKWETLALGRAGDLRAQVSQDGSRVIWTQRGRLCRAEGWAAENAEGRPSRSRRLPTEVCDVRRWKLSPTGDRVADVAYLTQNSRPDEMNVRFRVWDLLTGRPQMEEWVSIRRLRDNWQPGDALFWDDDGSLRLFVDDGWDLHLWRFTPEDASTTKLATLPVGDGDRSSARLHNGTYYGGAAELRFTRGGEQVLVAVRDQSDENTRSPKPLVTPESLIVDEPEDGEGETASGVSDGDWGSDLARIKITVWTGDLQSEIYSLPPTPALKYSVNLFPEHVVALGRNAETRGMVLRIGGPDGWIHELPSVFPMGRLGDSRLDVLAGGGRFILDLESGERTPLGGDSGQLPSARRFLLPHVNADGRVRRGDDEIGPSLSTLYVNWGDARNGDSIVRFDVDTGEEAPFFANR